jgi:hypothetical protein
MTAVCGKCGRDCRTALALSKHEPKCEGEIVGKRGPALLDAAPEFIFYDRHSQKGEKCPRCSEIWEDFLILDENTWVCLKCGCQFMPRERLNAVNEWKLKDAERKRAGNP